MKNMDIQCWRNPTRKPMRNPTMSIFNRSSKEYRILKNGSSQRTTSSLNLRAQVYGIHIISTDSNPPLVFYDQQIISTNGLSPLNRTGFIITIPALSQFVK